MTVTLRPQPLPDRAQLQADVTAADDDQVLGHLVEAEGLGRADDGLAVEREERQRDRLASRSPAGCGRPRASARPRRRSCATCTPVGEVDPRRAEDRLDLVLAEEEADAVGQLLTTLSLRASIAGQVEPTGRPTLMPCLREPLLRQVVKLAGVEQRLAGDAADVQAGAAQACGLFSTHATFMPSCAARIAAT